MGTPRAQLLGGCWCPVFEEHTSKKDLCRNCRHPKGAHDALSGICNYAAPTSADSALIAPPSELLLQLAVARQKHSAVDTLVDAQAAAAQETEAKRRSDIIAEIVSTERSYCAALTSASALAAAARGRRTISEQDAVVLFSNVESLRALHVELARKLETRAAQISQLLYGGDYRICDIFVAMGPMLRLYKEYSATRADADELLGKLMKKSKWVQLCAETLSKEPSSASIALHIGSILIAPIQRIPRYILLLQDLRRHTPVAHTDYADLEKALALLGEIAQEINAFMSAGEKKNRALAIQSSLIGGNVPCLLEAHRSFVTEGELHKITSRFIQDCRIFVFNDILVWSHMKIAGFWKYGGMVELGTAWTRGLNDTARFQNLFQLVGPRKTWTFYTDTAEEKAKWLKTLNGLIDALVEKDPSLLQHRSKEVAIHMRNGLWHTVSSRNRSAFDPSFKEAASSAAPPETSEMIGDGSKQPLIDRSADKAKADDGEESSCSCMSCLMKAFCICCFDVV